MSSREVTYSQHTGALLGPVGTAQSFFEASVGVRYLHSYAELVSQSD